MKKVRHFFTSLAKKEERFLCVVNGIIGDKLEKRKNPFSVQMALYAEDELLSITKNALHKIGPADNGKICILAHGSCSYERNWGFKDNPSANYGSLFQKDFGHAPFFLRYNTGLHISTNGRRLSDLLEKLVRCYPTQVNEIVLIGHSMGGLVFRSACHYAEKEKKKWVRFIRKIFYLGSPHLGTHFEKFGKLTTTVLKQIPNLYTKALAKFIDLRSDGIKDMRHGYIIDEDWQHDHAEKLFYLHPHKTPLLKSADHYLICSTLSKVANSKMGRLFGDGLVHPGSGTGRGLFQSTEIPFSESHCRIIPGLSHQGLQKSRRVYEQIREWCR